MRHVRKDLGRPGTSSQLAVSITADGTVLWRPLGCPLAPEAVCRESCAWYAEEAMGGVSGDPRWKMATCQGRPIGELVEADTAAKAREGIALLLERAAERDEAIAHARRWEDKAEEYRANAIRFGDERDALRARVDELEAVVARLQGAPTATQERAQIGIWLRNQSYETQWAGDLDFKKTAARIEAGEHWKKQAEERKGS